MLSRGSSGCRTEEAKVWFGVRDVGDEGPGAVCGGGHLGGGLGTSTGEAKGPREKRGSRPRPAPRGRSAWGRPALGCGRRGMCLHTDALCSVRQRVPVRGGPWCSSGSGSSSARPPCCAASPRPPWAPKARTSVMSVLAATGGGGRLSSPRVCVEDLWFSELGCRARVHVGQATLPGVGVHGAHGQRPGATPPSRGTRAAGPCRAVASGEGAGSGDSDTICHGVSALLWHLAQPWRHPEQARLWGSAALPPEARTASRGSWPLTRGDSWPAGRGSWASPRRCAGEGVRV